MDLKRIDELQNTLRTLRPLNSAELKRLREEFMIENTYDSNAIEGSTLTLRETALILQEGITIAEKPIKEHLEAIGHRDAFEYVISVADKNKPLTEQVIKTIHSLVLMNDASSRGVYRNVPVTILGSTNDLPQPYLVPKLMESLIAEYDDMKREKHIIEAIAEFHLRFEGTHPFIDGNGRTGRLMMNLELIKAGLMPINIKFSDRRKYYECFDDYFANGKIDILTNLIAGYEIYELERYINMLQ